MKICCRKMLVVGTAEVVQKPLFLLPYFFNSFSYLYEVVRTNFFADFQTFRNFSPQFRENCDAT